YAYHFGMAKVRHEWSSDNRTFVRFVYNFRREERYNWAGEQQGIDVSRGGTDRFNYNAAIGHTIVLSPSLILDLKASFLRFNDNQTAAASADTVDLATLGFSSDTVPLFRDYSHMPMMNIDGTTPGCVPFPGG